MTYQSGDSFHIFRGSDNKNTVAKMKMCMAIDNRFVLDTIGPQNAGDDEMAANNALYLFNHRVINAFVGHLKVDAAYR